MKTGARRFAASRPFSLFLALDGGAAAKAAFADCRAQLKALMPCILACPHISGFEKKRAKLFAASPALAYSAAALWGKLQGGKA